MPDTSPQAKLSFLPWVRQGAAAGITSPDVIPEQRGVLQPTFATVDVTLNINNNSPLPSTAIRLRGPADVVGIDAHQIVRTDPRPGSRDFESNLFAMVEFDRPDLPWLFTPAAATASSKLRPWLCLVVVRKQAGVQIAAPTVDSPLSILEIGSPAQIAAELPDLAECWAWAHAQAAADTPTPTDVKAALNDAPRSLSRLVCPRLLAPDTDYSACVVPTFDVGRKTGLGLPIIDADLRTLAPAWVLPKTPLTTPPPPTRLPVYYTWDFRTGPSGNFETLARALKKAAPSSLGKRSVGIGQAGFQWTPAADPTTQIEGALRALTAAPPSSVWSDANTTPFETKLADIVNAPAKIQTAAPTSDPVLAPTLYARWHKKRTMVTPNAANWFDQLNLDPRWRATAAIGTRVVQQHQEALMASAWEQAPDIQAINQRMRQLQLSMAVSESLHARHLMPIVNKATDGNEERLLRFAAPAFSRIRPRVEGQPPGPSLTAQMANKKLPPAAAHAAMRRIGRQRGPLSRRLRRQDATRAERQTWVARLNYGVPPSPAAPTPSYAMLPQLPTPQALTNATWNPTFRVTAENQALSPVQWVDVFPSSWDYPGYFRSAAVEHLSRIRPAPTGPAPAAAAPATTAGLVAQQMDPRKAIKRLAAAAVSTRSSALRPTAPGVSPSIAGLGVETVMAAPTFPQPMYQPLQELSSDLLLPGLNEVPPNSVVGLATNRAFLEAYMVGLNVEMARELLWRGYPTDQRGTYFRNFWGYDASQPGSTSVPTVEDLADIANLVSWSDARLGEASGAAAPAEFVLLLRSDLLRRYPNALIYLAPVVNGLPSDTSHVLPIFNGALPPDVSFFGFPLTPPAAIGNGSTTGYFVVIEEHPTEARFGVSPSLNLTTTHLPVGTSPPTGMPPDSRWATNAAAMAAITRRQPVRVAIRASQLVAPST